MMTDSPTPQADNRKHERRGFRSPALLLLPGGQTFAVQTLDISVGGVGVLAPANARNGTRLSIRLTLPVRPSGTTTFDAPVTVVHSVLSRHDEGFKVGLQFVDLEARSASAIRHYIAVNS